jgi:hypothetical protein
MIAMAQIEVDEEAGDFAAPSLLEMEVARYLDAVETFRAEDCEPTWNLERAAPALAAVL